MSADDARRAVLNDLMDAIEAVQPDDREVERLSDRVGVDTSAAAGVSDRIHRLVMGAARDHDQLIELLDRAPSVISKLGNVNSNLRALRRNWESLTGPVGETGTSANTDDYDIVGEIIENLRSIALLRTKFRDVLFAVDLVDVEPVSELHERLILALDELSSARSLLKTPAADVPNRVRTLASGLRRVQDQIEQSVDALVHYSQVNAVCAATMSQPPGVGVTENDRAAAQLLGLRELGACRARARAAISQLTVHCERVLARLQST